MVKKTKHIDLNYRPLKKSGAIEVTGSVPDSQVYQADKKEYTPDYTITPLSLFPRCNATDPSALSIVGNINAQLTNMKWYEIKNGVKKLIDAANPDYAITETGAEKGKILVKKNVLPIEPITLEFYAEYINEKRIGEKYEYRYRHLLHSINGTDAVPTLVIDSPSGGVSWIPYRDAANQTITAKLLVAEKDITDSQQCQFFFYRVIDDTHIQQITGNGPEDYEVVSMTKNSLTINRDYIGHENSYIVKASYTQDGVAGNVPSDEIAARVTTIKRMIPAIEADFKGVPNEVPEGTDFIFPEPIIRDTIGEIPNADKYFRCTWYRQEPNGEMVFLACGFKPKLPYTKGMLLCLDVQDLGPYCIVTTGMGPNRKIITRNGVIVKARKLQP